MKKAIYLLISIAMIVNQGYAQIIKISYETSLSDGTQLVTMKCDGAFATTMFLRKDQSGRIDIDYPLLTKLPMCKRDGHMDFYISNGNNPKAPCVSNMPIEPNEGYTTHVKIIYNPPHAARCIIE